MDAAAEQIDVAAAMPGFFDDLDGFHFDLAADEFCDAYAAAAAAPPGGWLAGSGVDSRDGSPESSVTDGPLAGDHDDDDGASMSAYVSELERILLRDDDEPACCPDGWEEELCVDDYFISDLLAAGDVDDDGAAAVGGVGAAAGGGNAADDEEESLAAREDEPASRKRARGLVLPQKRRQLTSGLMSYHSWNTPVKSEVFHVGAFSHPFSCPLGGRRSPIYCTAQQCSVNQFCGFRSSNCEGRVDRIAVKMVTPTVESNGVAQQQEGFKSVFSMEGGQGESSYINNCQIQSRNLQMVLHVLKETLEKVQLPEKLLTAADLGCSCGQNTLDIADVIVQHTAQLYGARGHAPPEFCFYFSDLPSNDFNTLFRLLKDSATAGNGSRRGYFAAGVPGSFHDRLFPEGSIDVFTSTIALHWLSEVPREVVDKGSAAYNKGKVFLNGASEETGLAYKRQFQTGLARFLRCRAVELKPGGAMFLLCIGRPSSAAPTDQGSLGRVQGQLFQDSWDDLLREGLIDSVKIDSFNVPLYAPTLEEFREAVDADGSFRINRLEMVIGSPPVVDRPDDPGAVGRAVANHFWSVLGVLVSTHLGEALSGELITRLQRRAEERAELLMEEMRNTIVVCSLSLA